jgi:hypothetical protein
MIGCMPTFARVTARTLRAYQADKRSFGCAKLNYALVGIARICAFAGNRSDPCFELNRPSCVERRGASRRSISANQVRVSY